MSSPTSTPATTDSTPSTTSNGIPRKSRVSRGGKQSSGTKSRAGYRRNRNTDGKETGQKRPGAPENEEELDESEQCIICANRIEYAAVTPCNHTTCHRCTFRQRALYEKRTCLICRSDNDRVIFTEEITRTFDDFSSSDFVSFDNKFNIEFTKDYVAKDTNSLLENVCSIDQQVFGTFRELCDHAKENHGKYYCLICSKFKKAFVEELPLYTYKQLQRHQVEGDGDDSGFKGHPECKHCHGKRFYSIDELNIHIRDKHERCHICDQYSPKTADYFRNYDSVYNHFKREHYICAVPACVEKRFVVFREDLDLTAHMLKEHGGLSGSRGVVIGSNSRHFHSQLSTNFGEGASRRATLAAAAMDSGSEEDDYQSLDIKKRRFEERAKHYLNYNSEQFSKFVDANNGFRSKRLTGKDLQRVYTKELFVHQTNEEIGLLVNEFMEFFPEGTPFHKDLADVARELQALQEGEQFPVLGNGSSTFNSSSWVAANSVGRKSSPLGSFPALAKPQKKTIINPTTAPIRYTTIIKKTPVKAPSVNTAQAPSTYKPTYLNGLNQNATSSSPILGQSKSASSSTTSLSNLSSRSNSASNLRDEKKFPALEKKTKKKVIPRVKELNIVDPNQWGSHLEQPTPQPKQEEDENFGIEIIDKRKQKLKRKQDRLLFSNI
ncbi:uncharacterized protein RJT20DRAFT_29997 [Scheffersomyces xylosifermentans]|uniref:uncharacterized protein n=1 Tax=Scheffersomyces xylosifermentans TaxID=1304137 RepID=UPI00315D729D